MHGWYCSGDGDRRVLVKFSIACRLITPHVVSMCGPIIPVTLAREGDAPVAPSQAYSPEWLNALTDAERQSPEIKEFSKRMHDSGGEHVTWLFWHYQERGLWTPPFALAHHGSMFFLDCGR
jgi:hypothetical protein